MIRALLLLVIVLACPSVTRAGEAHPAAAPGGFDPSTFPRDAQLPSRGGLYGVLDNGVHYAIERHAAEENEDRAHVRVVVNVGSLYETESQAGLAHGLEHVVFRGSKRYKAKKIESFMKKMGSVGNFAHQNGGTSAMTTSYFLNVPERPDKHLKRAIDIMADRVQAPRLDKKDVAAEIDIVLEEELSRRPTPAAKETQAHLYGADHPWVTRSPIGNRDSIAGFTPTAMSEFHKQWYRPERTHVVVVGDIEPEEVLLLIERSFGRAAVSAEPNAVVPDVPLPTGYAASLVEDDDVPLMSLMVNFSRPGTLPPVTMERLKDEMTRSIGETILRDRIRDFTSARGHILGAGLTGQGGPYINYSGFGITASEGFEHQAFKELLEFIDGVLTDGFSDQDVAMQKSLIKRGMEQGLIRQERVPSARIAGAWSAMMLWDALPVDSQVSVTANELLLTEITPNHVIQSLRDRFKAGRRILLARVEKGTADDVDLSPFEALFQTFLDRVDENFEPSP